MCFSALCFTLSKASATFCAPSLFTRSASASVFPLPSSTFDLPHPSQLSHPALASSFLLSAAYLASSASRSVAERASRYRDSVESRALERPSRVASRADSIFASRSSPMLRPRISFSAVPFAEAHLSLPSACKIQSFMSASKPTACSYSTYLDIIILRLALS